MAVAIGRTGSGKTTVIRKIADQARRIIVADPEGKWRFSGGSAIEVVSGAELLEALADLNAQDPQSEFRVIYRTDDAARMELAAPAAAFAYRNCTLCIDEIVWLCSNRRLPPYLMRILQVGRERRVNLLATTRSPAEVPPMLMEQASVRWFFRMEPGPSLETVGRRFGLDQERLKTIPEHEYLFYGDADTLQLIGREGLANPKRAPHTSSHNTRRRGGA